MKKLFALMAVMILLISGFGSAETSLVESEDTMANIPQVNVGGTVYNLKDTEAREQISNLKSALEPANLYNGNPHIGGYLSSAATATYPDLAATSDGWFYTDLIDASDLSSVFVNSGLYSTNNEFIIFYDSNKKPIGQVYAINPGCKDIPSGTKYIAVSAVIAHLDTLVISEKPQSEYSSPLSYNANNIVNIVKKEYLRLDYAEGVRDRTYGNNGSTNAKVFPLASATSYVSPFISLIGIAQISYINKVYLKHLVMLDNTNTNISSIYLQPNSNGTIDVPSNAVSCMYMCNGLVNLDTDISIVEGSTPPSKTYPQKTLINDIDDGSESHSRLSNKRILFVGDSITAGTNSNGGWPTIIEDEYDCITTNEGHDGFTIGRIGSRTDNLLDLLPSLGDNYDVVCLSGGYNDFTTFPRADIGELTPYTYSTIDETTFCGSLESYLRTARTKWIGAKVCFILTMRKEYSDTTVNERQASYWNLIRDACKKYAIPLLDLYYESGLVGCVVDGVNDVVTSTYYYNADGTHPNQAGYEYLAPQIANFIMSIL